LQHTEARLGLSRLGRRELAGVGAAAAGLGLLLGTGAARGLPRTETAAVLAVFFASLSGIAKRASP
jgi:hypothetical protein